MTFLSRKPAKKDDTLSLNDYMQQVTKAPIFVQYKALVGGPLAQAHAAVMFDCAIRSKDGDGCWQFSPDFRTNAGPAAPNTSIKFKPNAKQMFLGMVLSYLELDYKKIISRQAYMQKLRNDALRGFLKTELDTHPQPERTYWVDHRKLDLGKLARGLVGAGKDERAQENAKKAKAWVRYEMLLSPKTTEEQVSSAHRLIDKHSQQKISWPLTFKALSDISANQAPDAPPYRKVSTDPETYPSNFGGTYLLMEAMSQMATTKLPPRGDSRWANWALYAHAAVMAAQAFTDGNKRVARVAHSIVMVTGGIDFRAPSPGLGSRLANMRQAPQA